MTPSEWLRSKHGRMVWAALDTQALRVVAKYHRLGCGLDDLLESTRNVMAQQISAFGHESLAGYIAMSIKALNQEELMRKFHEELSSHIRRLCLTWLEGRVETVGGEIVNHKMLGHVFRQWRLKTMVKLKADKGRSLRRLDLSSWSPR